jgi:NADH:ubiquinone oxidoreductase subunit E
VLRYVAQGLEIPLTQVTGVATFYSYFSLEPRGRHQIKLCLGTACHVRGAQRGLVHLESKLGIEPGGCTKDGEIGLEVVRCLGACGLAPVVVVNQETFRQVDEHRLDQILDGCRKGRSETAEPTP